MTHGLISLAGWAALVCWVVTLAVSALIPAPAVSQGQLLFIGGFSLAALLLTVLWARGRVWWWKNKTRAMAYREGWQEAKERERSEAERAGRGQS